jgi:hypothetical protein
MSNNWIVLITVFELVILFFFQRYSPDYSGYKVLIEEVYPNTNFVDLIKFDPIFSLISTMLFNANFKFELIIFIISGFSIAVKNIFFSKYNFGLILCFLYFSSLFWLHELIQLRVALGTTFIIGAWAFYILEKKYKYWSYLALASGAHLSNFVFIIFNLLRNPSKLIYIIIIFYIGSNFLTSDVGFVFERILRYYKLPILNDIYNQEFKIFSILNLTSLSLFFLVYTIKSKLKNNFFKLFRPVPIIMVFLILIGAYIEIPVIAIRLMQLFLLPSLFIISIYLVDLNRLSQLVAIIFIAALFMYNFAYRNFIYQFF